MVFFSMKLNRELNLVKWISHCLIQILFVCFQLISGVLYQTFKRTKVYAHDNYLDRLIPE